MSLQTIQLGFCQRAVTVLSHAATPTHCWACTQRSGTPTRCSADRKLGHFQSEGQISGVGGVDEVHMTFEAFVTSSSMIPLYTFSYSCTRYPPCRDPRTAAHSMSTTFQWRSTKHPRETPLLKIKFPTPLSSVSAPSNDASVNAALIVNEGVKSDVLHNAAMAEN